MAEHYEITGGYIKNIVLRAAFMAAAEGGTIDTALLHHAAALEMEDLGWLRPRATIKQMEDR